MTCVISGWKSIKKHKNENILVDIAANFLKNKKKF